VPQSRAQAAIERVLDLFGELLRPSH
jgi:hypothetical protein